MLNFNLRSKFINLFGVAIMMAMTPLAASATWSVIAVDARTGRIVIASATCVPQGRLIRGDATGLMNIQAVVIPGIGVAAAQAGVDRTRQNQRLIYAEMKKGTNPSTIIEMLSSDPDFQRRQFGIVDLTGRMAGFSGSSNSAASLSVQGRLPDQDIYFSIQGNILASNDVVYEAVSRFMSAEGTLTDRVMAAMEGADEAGGDVRCTCETDPIVEAPCHGKNAHVAYILAADPSDTEGSSFNDGQYAMFIDVTDQNILPHENSNPVLTLRQRYGTWKADRRKP
jgi:uncharacterized Ntn-hydrolase superfamily protein